MIEEHIFVALIAALVNLVLSVLVPCSLKKSNLPLLAEVKKLFSQHSEMLFTSSVLVGVIVFLSLEAAPIISEMGDLSNLTKLGNAKINNVPIGTPVLPTQMMLGNR